MTAPAPLDFSRFGDALAAVSLCMRLQVAVTICTDATWAARELGAFSATARLQKAATVLKADELEVS